MGRYRGVAGGKTDPRFVIASEPGSGGGPHVRVFNALGQAVQEFLAYDPGFIGGVHVAIGSRLDL